MAKQTKEAIEIGEAVEVVVSVPDLTPKISLAEYVSGKGLSRTLVAGFAHWCKAHGQPSKQTEQAWTDSKTQFERAPA